MRKATAAYLLLVVFAAAPRAVAGPPEDLAGMGKKIVIPDWLEQGTLKWGFVGSLCLYQSLNGMTEGRRFRQGKTHLINEGNYHAFATVQRIAGITTGWFGYANFRNDRQGWLGKLRRLVGSAMLGRNFFEWSYKGVRYGNPFDYTEEHNRHSLVYFGMRNGKITDLYIGTGPVTGPLVDMAFLMLGWIILE